MLDSFSTCFIQKFMKSKKIGNDRNSYNQIPHPALKTKREITKYINWQQFMKGMCGKPNEQLFPRQVVIQLHKLIHVISYPYLTLWDKISQNLAHLLANSRKIFQISQNFQTILKHILWRNKHKSHFVMFITSFIYKLFWERFKVIFIKISEFYQNLH